MSSPTRPARTVLRVALALFVALGSGAGLAACGDDDDEASAPEKTKPTVELPAEAPAELVVSDIEKGSGKAAKNGDTLLMQYVGIALSTKEQFDASWDRGEPFDFVLGTGGVIPGWDQGLVGMKEGGRRQLVIPPALGYPDGRGDKIKAGETLVFVVDLLEIS